MARRLPPLKALADFEAASRHLSFTKAAAELNVTHGAVSRQVKAIEDFLGRPLFRRQTRALRLTDDGRFYATVVRELLERLMHATESVKRRDGRSRITVSTTYSFSIKWLVPRLARFRARHPEIDVRLQADDDFVDFARDEVDIAIRYGAGTYPGLKADRLMIVEYAPLCSPRLLEGKHALRKPGDLRHHALLHEEHVPFDWPAWLAAAGVKDIDASRGPIFSHSSMVIQAAIAGEGVALTNLAFARGDLAQGHLVKPFDISLKSEIGCDIVCPPASLERADVRVFREWLLEEAAGEALPGTPDAGAPRARRRVKRRGTKKRRGAKRP